MLVIVASWFVLYSSSSLACSLCLELEKRGFSPEVIGKAVAEHFGGTLKAVGSGQFFHHANGIPFNLAIGKNGKLYPVTAIRQLRGISFDGFINDRPAKVFVADGINFVGIKTDASIPARTVRLAQKEQPVKKEHPVKTAPPRQRAEAQLPETASQPEGQIIETSLDDASTLLAPTNQVLQGQKEMADRSEQLAKRAEFKKRAQNQKFLDAGVTTTAVISGLAIPPPIGPIIAASVILGRVGYGLFQNNSDE